MNRRIRRELVRLGLARTPRIAREVVRIPFNKLSTRLFHYIAERAGRAS